MTWTVGDRAVWPREVPGSGRQRRHTIRIAGTVTGVDLIPGAPGVQLTFDEPDPYNGATQCYATHRELEPEDQR
ncbi:MAG TPA: hypothetical protein VGJ13_05145 [Pseudonocardiaceae bacterium]